MNSLKLIFTQSKHFAPALVFASLNVVFGTWAIYIPSIKAKLEINEGQLGLAIFYMALGTLTMIVLAPKIINRFGVGKATAYGIFIFLFSFIIPFIAEQYGCKVGDMPVTDAVVKGTLALPFHNNLTEPEVQLVCKELKDSLSEL